ncbi:MAG: AmmeMemoRadiSam system protein A [Brevefilum sp.]
MTTGQLTKNDQEILLKIARDAIVSSTRGESPAEILLSSLPAPLQEQRASFVTLTINGRLRGCIGTLEAYQPLANDVQEHALAAAFRDHRFSPVQPEECSKITIGISVLTPKTLLHYDGPQDLIEKLQPRVDGVVLQDGSKKATFLPQVWDQLPEPAEFLTHLCIKMGASGDLWRKKSLQVFTYQVQEFHE